MELPPEPVRMYIQMKNKILKNTAHYHVEYHKYKSSMITCPSLKERQLQTNLMTRVQEKCYETENKLAVFRKKIVAKITFIDCKIKSITNKITMYMEPRNIRKTGFISTISFIIMPQILLITFIEYTKYKARCLNTTQNPYNLCTEDQSNDKNIQFRSFIPVVLAVSEESKASKPETEPKKPPRMKYTDLSIYNSPHSKYKEYQEDKGKSVEYKEKLLHNWLYSYVKQYRHTLSDRLGIVEWFQCTGCAAEDTYSAMQISGNRFLTYMRDENNTHLRKAVIAIGTTTGAILGSTKFYLSRNIFFGILAGLFTGWLCYPQETDKLLRNYSGPLANIIVRLLNLTGMNIKLEKKDSVPCMTDLCKTYAKDCSDIDWRDCTSYRLKRTYDEHLAIQKIIEKHRSLCEERENKEARESSINQEVESKIESGRNKQEEVESKIESGRKKLKEVESKFESGRTKLEEVESKTESDRSKLEEVESKIENGNNRLEEVEREIENGH